MADWEIRPDRLVVRRQGLEHALEPRLMDVLVHLAARPGDVVSRRELLDSVWGETVVQEEALTQAVSHLRKVFDDDPKNPSYIETVPKRGYRLVAPVRPLEKGGATPRSRRLPRAAALVVLVGLALVLWRWGPGDQPPVLLDTRPLTTLPGDEAYPAVSPDGRFVVFSRLAEGGDAVKLHLKRLDSQELTALTDEPGNEYAPCWSPDGERVAFERRVGPNRRVCVVAAIGGPVQGLGPVHWSLGGLDWSPDGATIVYSAKDEQEAPMRLFRLHVADGRVDTLTSPEDLSRGDTNPRFSPDGSTLALVRSDRGIAREIHLMPAEGGDPERLTDAFFATAGLDWAPDGRSLVLSATLRGTYELWRVDARSGAMTSMPLRIHRALSPSWSTSGAPLVFTDNTLDADLVTGRFDGPGETFPAPSTRLDVSPRFSPDGRAVVFISDRGGSRELWLLDRADGSVRPLTDFAGEALRKPRWSPDGRRVAVNVGREGLLQVVVIDVTTGLERQVTSAPVHHRLGHWSRDGGSLFYSYEDGPEWRIARIRVDGTDARDLPVPGCATIHEEPGGDLIYFKETEDGLFRTSSDGAEETVVRPENLFDLMNLQVADGGYWYIRRGEEGNFLSFFDFSTGETADRVTLEGRPTGEFHVSPDGAEFAYTSIVRTGNDLVIVDDPR